MQKGTKWLKTKKIVITQNWHSTISCMKDDYLDLEGEKRAKHASFRREVAGHGPAVRIRTRYHPTVRQCSTRCTTQYLDHGDLTYRVLGDMICCVAQGRKSS